MKALSAQLNLTTTECEVITLKAVFEMINDMVNHEVMMFSSNSSETEIRFKTATHMAYFNILLVDFLSVPKEFFQEEKTYLDRLLDICKNPLLTGQIDTLKKAVEGFCEWLQQPITIERTWFPNVNLEVDLTIQRRDFILICGNMGKHNFTQQTRQAKKLLRALEDNGHSVALDKCLMALPDFYEQFHRDILVYRASTIAEFLNNIRWGIYEYVSTERSSCVSHFYDKEIAAERYEYAYPAEVKSELGKAYYWNLMNDVIRKPHVHRFEVSKYAKMRY